MAKEEITLYEIRSGGGKFYEIGRCFLDAAIAAELTPEQTMRLWSNGDFAQEVVGVLSGRARIVQLPALEFVSIETISVTHRMEVLKSISDEDELLEICLKATLPECLRTQAFSLIKADKTVVRVATATAKSCCADEGEMDREREISRFTKTLRESMIPNNAAYSLLVLLHLDQDVALSEMTELVKTDVMFWQQTVKDLLRICQAFPGSVQRRLARCIRARPDLLNRLDHEGYRLAFLD